MSRVDAEIGRLMAFLDESGLAQNTLVIFTSDHGEEMGDHWLIGKGGYFDGSYRIPLIVRDPRPGAARGAPRRPLHRERRHHADHAGGDRRAGPGPVRRASASRRSCRAQRRPAGASEAHWEFDFRNPLDDSAERTLGLTLHQCALNVVRGERYKYVHFTKLPPLFFDLEADPGETRNLADDPAYAPLVLAYAQKLLSWRMNHDEQTLTHVTLPDAAGSRPVEQNRAPR